MQGQGTVSDPYVITNAQELQAINDNLSAHYILGNHIDCGDTVNWNGGEGFVPITDFAGTLDGQGFCIESLYIHREASSSMFSKLVGATIKQVKFKLPHVHAGYSNQASVLCNYLSSKSVITECAVVDGEVLGGLDSGIFVGKVDTGCYVENCYAIGTITTQAGSSACFAGFGYGGVLAKNCYSAVVPSFGLIRVFTQTINYPECPGCYWNSTLHPGTVGSTVSGLSSATDEQMKQQATFVGWDFGNTWYIDEGSNYPELKAFMRESGGVEVSATGVIQVQSMINKPRATRTKNTKGNISTKVTIAPLQATTGVTHLVEGQAVITARVQGKLERLRKATGLVELTTTLERPNAKRITKTTCQTSISTSTSLAYLRTLLVSGESVVMGQVLGSSYRLQSTKGHTGASVLGQLIVSRVYNTFSNISLSSTITAHSTRIRGMVGESISLANILRIHSTGIKQAIGHVVVTSRAYSGMDSKKVHEALAEIHARVGITAVTAVLKTIKPIVQGGTSQTKIRTLRLRKTSNLTEISSSAHIDNTRRTRSFHSRANIVSISTGQLLRRTVAQGFITITTNITLLPPGVTFEPLHIYLNLAERPVKLDMRSYLVNMGVVMVPLLGNTIRITAEFCNLAGEVVEVKEPTITIYDKHRNVVEVITTGIIKRSDGSYYYDYTLPTGKRIGEFVEFSGMLDDMPILKRERLVPQWV